MLQGPDPDRTVTLLGGRSRWLQDAWHEAHEPSTACPGLACLQVILYLFPPETWGDLGIPGFVDKVSDT